VVVAFFAALAGATPLLPRHALWYVIVVNAAAAGLIGICWWKGERPRWRWGDEA
jgi:Na+-driven multidrug efflux pump